MKNNPANILITGATGLVGAQLTLHLIRNGYDVCALRRSTSKLEIFNRIVGGFSGWEKKVTWIEGDVTNIYDVSEAVEGMESVFHCAAEISFVPSDFNRMMRINANGTANLVNASLRAGVKRFVHISSVAALGRSESQREISESNTWKTSKLNSGYAISKYSAEREVWRAMEEGLNALIVNPSIILGPGNWRSGSAAFFDAVWNGLKFYPEGVTGFIDVRDVADCTIALWEKNCSGQRFILSAENKPYRFVLDTIAEVLNKPKPSIRATPLLGNLAWRIEWLRSKISRHRPVITRETVRNSSQVWDYRNDKIRTELHHEFIPVERSLKDTGNIFLEEMRMK